MEQEPDSQITIRTSSGNPIRIERGQYNEILDSYAGIEDKRGAERKVAKVLDVQQELVRAVLRSENQKQRALKKEK